MRQTPRKWNEVNTFVAGKVRLRERSIRLFREKEFSPTFLNGSTCLLRILTTNRASAKTALPKSVPTITEAFVFFHEIAHVAECMTGERF